MVKVHILYFCLIRVFVLLINTWNSRVQGHGIRIVSYALVGLVTVVVLLK